MGIFLQTVLFAFPSILLHFVEPTAFLLQANPRICGVKLTGFWDAQVTFALFGDFILTTLGPMPIPTVASVVKWLGQAEILGLVAGCFVFGVKGILYIWRRFGRKGLVLFFALSWVLRRRLFQTTSEIVVRFLQWHLNTFWALVSLRIFAIQLSSIANDQKPVLDYVAGMRTRYGPRHAELVTVLEPSTTHELRDRMTGPIRDVPFKFSLDEWGLAETPLHMLNPPPPSDLFRPSSTVHLSCNRLGSTSKIGSPIPILYIHGGGFVAANAAVLMQSVTPLVREGFTVYCIDYPLAPDNRFPIPVISVLRAMFWWVITYFF